VQRRSWLSVQFVGVPGHTPYVIALVVWAVLAFGPLHPRVEDAMAWKVWRLRPPNALESSRLGPAWFAVCAAACVDPNRYRVWIHEGPEATAPATAGSTVAVTSWSVMRLGIPHLEAILAHELAHRLALPRSVSLIIYGLSMPARLMGKAIVGGWKQPFVGFAIKVVIGFLLIGVIGVWALMGFSHYIVFMLSPLAAPFIIQAAARASEKYADRCAADLGYGARLAEVFTGREYERAQAWAGAPRQSLQASQPLDSARLRALERLLSAEPQNGHRPR
jgi:Zn-dependent protease with chaperone function